MWRWWFTVLFWSGGNPSHPLFSQVPLYKSVTEMATNSCFSASKRLASLWMLLIYPWERWKIPHGSQIYLLRAISSILKMLTSVCMAVQKQASPCEVLLTPLWGFHPVLAATHWVLALPAPSSHGQVRKGLVWAAASREYERECCRLSCWKCGLSIMRALC